MICMRSVSLAIVLFVASSAISTAANRVVVQSTTIPAGPCYLGTANVSIENDVDLYSVSIPFVVRSIGSGGAFWTSADRRTSAGRLASSLTGMQLLEKGRVDFSSPDQLVLHFEASDILDCLASGPIESMTGLTFKTTGAEGQFEIDTAMYPPCYSPIFTACADQQPIVWDEFVKGLVTVFALPPDGCFGFVSFDSTSLTAWAGAELLNDADVSNPTGDPMGFRLVSGPGSIDSLSGLWMWRSSPAEIGVYQIGIQPYLLSCPSEPCPQFYFPVTLKQLVPGDLNCDGIVNIVDVVTEVGHTFRAEPPPTPCWDL